MGDGKCIKHGCEYTGFGTLIFCPICEIEDDTTNSEGFFADFMGQENALKQNADVVSVYEDLDHLKNIAQDIVDSYAKFAGDAMKINIFKVQRTDLHDIQFEQLNNEIGLPLPFVMTDLFAGFSGCTWHSLSWTDVTNMPRALIDSVPLVVITSTKAP